MEDLVAWIHAPLLERLVIILFDELIFDPPQLVRFISCTPMFETPIEARVFFDDTTVGVLLPSSKQIVGTEAFMENIRCFESNRQLPCLAHLLASPL